MSLHEKDSVNESEVYAAAVLNTYSENREIWEALGVQSLAPDEWDPYTVRRTLDIVIIYDRANA